MEVVDAVAGRFSDPAAKAANDMAARLVMLAVLLWISAYAKTCAKFFEAANFSRRSIDGRNLEAIPLYPVWLRFFPLLLALEWQCQNEHLPTQTARRRTVSVVARPV